MSVKLNTKYLAKFVGEDELTGIKHQVEAAAEMLHSKTGLGSDFLGWLTLPTDYDKEEFARIQAAAKKIQSNADILIVIGIGGSYLGARAAIEFLKSPFYNNLKKDTPDIYLSERGTLDLRGQGYLRKRHLQVWCDNRTGAGIPCVQAAG